MSKNIQLLADEFIPFSNIGKFWQLPKSIMESPGLSLGAKVLYAVLVGLGSKRGTAWPEKKTLQKHLGYPSIKTIYRWQRELVDAQLIRVHQKGRGLSNNYYFLRHPLLEDSYTGEFGNEPRYVYTDPATGTRTLKTKSECWTEFMPVITAWVEQQKTEKTSFPKPHWRYDQKDYKEMKAVIMDTMKFTETAQEQAEVTEHAERQRVARMYFQQMEEIRQIAKGEYGRQSCTEKK